MMTFVLSEMGLDCFLWDASPQNVDEAIEMSGGIENEARSKASTTSRSCQVA